MDFNFGYFNNLYQNGTDQNSDKTMSAITEKEKKEFGYQATLKEFEVLHQYETIESPKIKYNLVNIGLATIGLLLYASVNLFTSEVDWMNNSSIKSITMFIGYIICLPLFCFALKLTYMGEVQRMLRMSTYVHSIEKRINAEIGNQILTWNSFVSIKKNRIVYPDVLVIGIFTGLSLAFQAIGVYYCRFIVDEPRINIWLIVFAVSIYQLITLFFIIRQGCIILKLEKNKDEQVIAAKTKHT